MTNNIDQSELLADFRDSPQMQEQLATWLSIFADLCTATAETKGFHDDEQRLRQVVAGTERVEWFECQLLQAEFGRMMSECGEGIEAVRTGISDDHLPQYPGWLAEIADMMIRGGDSAAKRHEDFGRIVVAKMLYNLNRPYKHGKNS